MTVASAIAPPGVLIGIWRLDAAAGHFLGWSPVRGAPNDFQTVNRLEPAFLCLRQAGTLTRPALPEVAGTAPSPPPPSQQGEGVCSEISVTTTRDVIASLDPARKRELTPEVVAVKTFGLPERQALEIVLYHLPSGSQLTIDAQGGELRREVCSAEGAQALTAILDDPRLLAQALELAQ